MIVQERSRVLVRGVGDFCSAAALLLSRACHAVAGRHWLPAPEQDLGRLRFDRAELAGAVADLGVMVPIAVALIVKNGLSATAVLLPAGLLYVAAGLLYRVPVPVQPLKAFGAIAIAQGLGSSEIAAGALLMGGVFVALGASGWLDRAATVFPHPIRGVQLSVGLLFCQLAWTLSTAPPATFADHARPGWWAAEWSWPPRPCCCAGRA